MAGQGALLELVVAACPPRGLTGRLNRRQQQRHEHADDRNDDQ
jgi:hypothetical protein